jgi:hypothetical protein
MGLRELWKKIPMIGSLGRGDHALEGDRPVENIDAMGAAYMRDVDLDATEGGGGIPPNYVKSYDEGRPRK